MKQSANMQLFGIDLFSKQDFLELLFRFGLNFLVTLVIIRFLYYPATRRKDYLFTYILIATVVFLLCILLDSVSLKLGFALGLFAIFGIIRYRTNPIAIKEMTYLFVVIGISVINALSNEQISYAELLFTNFSVLIIIFALERVFLLKHESSKNILDRKSTRLNSSHYS